MSLLIAYTVLVWWVPFMWMMLWKFKPDLLDWLKLPIFAPLVVVFDALVLIRPKFIFGNVYSEVLPLVALYGTLAYMFSIHLVIRGWHVLRALCIGFLVAYAGSFFWEIPHLIRNAFITGFQPDWLFHILSLSYIIFLAHVVGFHSDENSFLVVVASLVTSTFFMLFWPVPPSTNPMAPPRPDIWNNPYWMLNRTLGTLTVFAVVRKDPK